MCGDERQHAVDFKQESISSILSVSVSLLLLFPRRFFYFQEREKEM
jgi:hypothetical protein